MLTEIIFLNNLINKRSSGKVQSIQDSWEHLQLHVAFLMNSEISVPHDLNMVRNCYMSVWSGMRLGFKVWLGLNDREREELKKWIYCGGGMFLV